MLGFRVMNVTERIMIFLSRPKQKRNNKRNIIGKGYRSCANREMSAMLFGQARTCFLSTTVGVQ